jgi:integrase
MEVSRGTVYLRGGTWTIGYTVGGRRVREAIGSNRQMAEQILKKRIVEAIEDRHFDKRNTGRIPFSEFADTYMDRCISILKSTKTERIRVLFWKRIFGNRPIGQITTAELQDWQAQKRATNKPATVNHMMSRLRHMFNRAIEWELLDESPMRRIKFLRENNARLRYLSIEECGRLLDGCGVAHMRGIITVALHTGMRLGEILDLKHPDIDFVTGVLTVRSSKNGESRHIPMDSSVAALFKWIPKQSNSEYVFPSPSGERWSCNQKAFRHARSRAGLVDLHFHDLRHTFASQWMMNGGDLYALRGILGHKSIAMTQRYAHLSPAYQRAMVDRMEAIWAKPAAAMDKAPVPPRPRPSRRRIPEAHLPVSRVSKQTGITTRLPLSNAPRRP